MLVLSRKEAQRIRVGDSIVVSIVKIAGDKVRVGIEAPSDVLVLRDELEAWDENGPSLPQAEKVSESVATMAADVELASASKALKQSA